MDMFPEHDAEPPADNESLESRPAEAPPEAEPGSEKAPAPEQPAQARRGFDDALGEIRQSLREEETKEQTGFGSGLRRWVQKVLRRKTAPLPEVTEERLDEFAIPESPRRVEPKPPAQAVPDIGASSEAGEQPPSESSSFQKLVQDKITGALPGKDSMEPLVGGRPRAPEEYARSFLSPKSRETDERTRQSAEDSARGLLAPDSRASSEAQQEPGTGHSILSSVRGAGQETEEADLSSLREAALQDYVAEPTAEEAAATPLPQRLRRGWRDMRPMDRTLLTITLAFLGVVALIIAGYVVIEKLFPEVFGTPTPVPPTATASKTPYPISITLPGGIVFPLKVGYVQNGKWDPQGAEWLAGTEVCRWVALPYNVQLEAVLRTLKAGDPIQLSMSNYDSIVFKVQKITEQPAGEITQLCPEGPAVLVILSKQNAPTRWVVVGQP